MNGLGVAEPTLEEVAPGFCCANSQVGLNHFIRAHDALFNMISQLPQERHPLSVILAWGKKKKTVSASALTTIRHNF